MNAAYFRKHSGAILITLRKMHASSIVCKSTDFKFRISTSTYRDSSNLVLITIIRNETFFCLLVPVHYEL